ncbi:M56 family metallopeptidase [Flavobacterium sp. IMCC34518]|uniref:M56 family metallopeptidase n=1 Tax=Flavobacterium sp. IMCC34518 TaxID=3003623 RepID=UPI00248250FE|nr:M56 family metallopeptidase [Flavobacterium sp. IMCC34518]
METLFLNIAKSSGLIAMFYIAYYFLLRKETFFTANRWYLLAGLFTSVILPWIIFTTIVWVEPTPNNFDWSKIPHSVPVQKESFEINWQLVLVAAYGIGTVLFLIQFAFDFYSLNRVLKGKTIQQHADHKFIDLKENVAPFSYFNTIVYNSTLYTQSELESILEHEKVHSEQYHTIDVLITRLFCILFWFNPFVWLYKKAILQNLEFIADSEATKNLSDKKAYQLTLLKITAHENCVVLTNHFYQSLIKKRIVMLNKNQSKKWNSWKYVLVVPALVAFVFLFQMEVIAKEKNQIPKAEKLTSTSNDEDVYKITKNTTEEELKEKAETINKSYGITVLFSNTKRNSNNELTAITVELKKGKEISSNRNVASSEAIKPFGIAISKDSKGMLGIDFVEEDKSVDKLVVVNNIVSADTPISDDTQIYINGSKSDKVEMDKLDPNEIATVNVNKNNEKQEIRIITKKFAKIGSENAIYINDEKVDQNELDNLDQGTIERMDVNKEGKTIRIITKNRTYNQDKNMPVPPVPPTPPVMKFKTPAAPPFPKAPKAPKGDPINGDKKAWKEFDKKMEDYDAKMKKLEPQMEAFDKQMAEFDKQMEPFNEQMEIFEEKMKVYEKQMEEYQSKMDQENN